MPLLRPSIAAALALLMAAAVPALAGKPGTSGTKPGHKPTPSASPSPSSSAAPTPAPTPSSPPPAPSPTSTPTATPTATPSSVPTSSPNLVFLAPSSIAADCSTPVEGALSNWLAQLPDGATAVLSQDGCYAVADNIALNDAHNLTIDGNGATTRLVTTTNDAYSAAFGNLSVWRIQGGNNITLRNLTVRGDNPYTGTTFYPNDRGPECAGSGDLEWQHGIAFDGTDGGHLVGVNVNHVCGDFVEADTDGRTLDPSTGQPLYAQNYARNITISGGTFTIAGRMAFGLVNVQGFSLDGATISYVNEAAVDIEPDIASERASDVSITNNAFHWVRFSLLSSGGDSANAGNVTFSGNSATGTFTCQPPIWVGPPSGVRRSGYTITNNRLNPFGTLGTFVRTSNVTIQGNHDGGIYGGGGCSQVAGVVLAEANTVLISGNDFGPTVTAVVQAGPDSTGVVEINNLP